VDARAVTTAKIAKGDIEDGTTERGKNAAPVVLSRPTFHVKIFLVYGEFACAWKDLARHR
jgi:hypothetical protein